MKWGNFKDLAKKRFSKEKIAQMNREVAHELQAMRSQKINCRQSVDGSKI